MMRRETPQKWYLDKFDVSENPFFQGLDSEKK